MVTQINNRRKLMDKSTQTIPNFGLYGESSTSTRPGYIHIEDIAARSSSEGWLIKPHRHGRMFQILCVFDGQLVVRLDTKSHALSGCWAITIPAGVVHGFRFQPDSKGVVLTIAEPLLSEGISDSKPGEMNDFVSTPRLIEFQKENILCNQLLQYIEAIKVEFQNFNADLSPALELLARLILHTLHRQLHFTQLQALPDSSNLLASNRFRALLEKNYRNHWKVEQYAQALHMSASTLNRLCHDSLNMSTKTVIHKRVLAEAKRRLIYTRESLHQMAYTLGFKDPAYFSRYFKKWEGIAPGDYRKMNDYTTLPE